MTQEVLVHVQLGVIPVCPEYPVANSIAVSRTGDEWEGLYRQPTASGIETMTIRPRTLARSLDLREGVEMS